MKHFKHKIGENRVVRKNYRIAQAHGGTLVDAEGWNDIMNTGEELTMVMLLDRLWRQEASQWCPKCEETPIGIYEEEGWQIWYAPGPNQGLSLSHELRPAVGATHASGA